MKINRLAKREIILFLIFTLFLLHVYIFQGVSRLSDIFPATLVRLFTQIESRFYDYRIRSLGEVELSKKKLMLNKSLAYKKYDVGSKEFARHFDAMFVDSGTSKDVAILAIDEKTMDEVGQWPIRRDTYAKLMDRVFEDGEARALAYDIVFKEKGDTEPIRRIEQLRTLIPADKQVQIDRHVDFLNYDRKMENAFRKYSDRVVGGYTTLQDSELSGKDFSKNYFPKNAVKYGMDWNNERSKALQSRIESRPGGIFNYEKLRMLMHNRGFFNIPTDENDGVVRKAPLLQIYPVRLIDEAGEIGPAKGEIFGSLGLQTFMLTQGSVSPPELEGLDSLTMPSSTYYVFSELVYSELLKEIRTLMLKPKWLSNSQRNLLEIISGKLSLRKGRFPEFNTLLIQYASGFFDKDKKPSGFYENLANESIYGLKRFNNYLLRDLSPETIEKLNKIDNPASIRNELEPAFINFEKNMSALISEIFFEPIRWHLDSMYSFNEKERNDYYDYLKNSILFDRNFVQRFYKQENFSQKTEQLSMDFGAKSYISYNGAKNTYLFISLADVLNRDKFRGTLHGFPTPEMTIKEALKNKILFLGPTALGINDWRVTPVDKQLDGVEIHTSIFDMLRQGKSIVRNDALNYEFFLIILAAILIPLLLNRLGAKWGALLILGILGGYYSFCDLMFFEHGTYYQFTPLAIELIVFYLYLNTRNYIIEERERKKTKAAFSNYVNANVVDEVLKDPDMLKLGGTRKEVSVLFSDVRSFTTISEGLPPEELVSLMNEYLTEMTDLVLDYDGTLDKFIGDAVMAFWGAPINQKNHYELATLTAIDMNLKVNEMRPYFLEKYNVPIHVGIGISTGSAVVGNMGSISRFDYTMLGDTVNLGARLEGQTKNYGVELIISQTTYDYVNQWAATRFLDLIAVKGKTEPVKIYECPNRIKDCSEFYLEGLAKFNEAVDTYYMGRRFEEGIQVFKDLKKYRDGDDKACDLYIDRCKNFLENPPDEDWNGVFVATSK